MAWKFRSSKKLVGGLRVNYSSNGGLGFSVGVNGARVGINQKEVRTTLSVPGTGIINTERHSILNNGNKTRLKRSIKRESSKTGYAGNSGLNTLKEDFLQLVSCSGTDAEEYKDNLHEVGQVTIGLESIQFEWELDKNIQTHRSDEVVSGGFSINKIKYRSVSCYKVDDNYGMITIKFDQPLTGNQYSMIFKGSNIYTQSLYKRIEQYKSQQQPYKLQQQKSQQQCFVATAVYGNFDCPEVLVLRRWRDTFLTRHYLGRVFIKN